MRMEWKKVCLCLLEGRKLASAEVLLVSPGVFHVCRGNDVVTAVEKDAGRAGGWMGKSPNTIITGAIQSNKMKRY